MNALFIIVTGVLVASSCSLLGTYLVLRKMAMVSDAISHAVLPGIVIAYMLAGGDNSFAVLAGAALMGLVTTFLIELFHKVGRLQTDASIGVTFTWLFAIGVIMVSYYAGDAHIDQECVLYGEIAYVPIDLWITSAGINLGPQVFWIMGPILLLILLFIRLNYKELQVSTFDPSFSQVTGISPAVWHYSLMSLVSLATVGSFESVGAILVVAFLVVPAATAYLITDRLANMLVLSVVFGSLSAIVGYYLAVLIDGSIAGAMATVCGIIFLIVFIVQKIHQDKKRKSIALNNPLQS